MRTFKFHMQVDGEDVGDEGIIEIDQSVIDYAYSEEFKKDFYTFYDDESIINHIVYNFVINHEKLSSLEGFIMSDDLAKIIQYPHGYNKFDISSEEII